MSLISGALISNALFLLHVYACIISKRSLSWCCSCLAYSCWNGFIQKLMNLTIHTFTSRYSLPILKSKPNQLSKMIEWKVCHGKLTYFIAVYLCSCYIFDETSIHVYIKSMYDKYNVLAKINKQIFGIKEFIELFKRYFLNSSNQWKLGGPALGVSHSQLRIWWVSHLMRMKTKH